MIEKIRRTLHLIPGLVQFERRLDDLKINQGRILAAMNRDQRLPELRSYEFKIFSQWGEDGILQHLTTHLKILHHDTSNANNTWC